MSSLSLEARHDRWQDALLAAGVIGLLGMVLEALGFAPDPSPWYWLNVLMRLVGWLAFVIIWMRLAYLTGNPNSQELLTAPVDDERVRALRGEAMQFALTAVLVTQLVFLLGIKWIPMTQDDTASITIAVAQVAAIWQFRRRSRA